MRADLLRSVVSGRLAHVWMAALLLLGASCELPPDEGAHEGPARCESTADCQGDLICHAEGVCTVAPEMQQAREVSFVFSPTTESGQLAQRSRPLEASTATPLDFVLEPSITVIGEVRNAGGQRIQDGTLIFAPKSDLNGVLRRQTEISDENVEIAGEDANFTIELLPGLYDVTFISGDEEIPNRRWPDQMIGESLTSLPLVLPPSSAITTIEGTITHRDPDLDLDPLLERLPVSGARVQAIAQDGTTSTASVTDAQGNFSIQVWQDNGVHDLRVGPATPNAPIPQVLEQDAFDATSGLAQAIAVDLGTWSTARFELRVMLLEEMLGEGLEGLDFVPSDARLILTGTLPDGKTLTYYSNPNADEPLTLIPIPYTVSLVPPPTSQFGVLTFEWDPLTQASLWQDRELALPRRRALTALVTDAFGVPIQEARVELRARLPEAAPQGEADTTASKQAIETESRTFTVQTDALGEVRAWLEPGWTYDVSVLPPNQSSAPTGSFTISSEDVGKEAGAYTFALPKPMLLSGSINRLLSDMELAPLADTSFQIYDEEVSPPRQIAQGRTSSDGTFRVLLPLKD